MEIKVQNLASEVLVIVINRLGNPWKFAGTKCQVIAFSLFHID